MGDEPLHIDDDEYDADKGGLDHVPFEDLTDKDKKKK